MTYYITWVVDGPAMLTTVDSERELRLDQLMALAFEVEEVEPETSYDLCSIIRAENAEVIW